jgi:hypothetical protein
VATITSTSRELGEGRPTTAAFREFEVDKFQAIPASTRLEERAVAATVLAFVGLEVRTIVSRAATADSNFTMEVVKSTEG